LNGVDVRHNFSKGEQAQGAYCVSTRETVLAKLTVPEPESTWMARPKPSSVVTFQRCGAPDGWGLAKVAVCVFTLLVLPGSE
jgi:hypothetical protein